MSIQREPENCKINIFKRKVKGMSKEVRHRIAVWALILAVAFMVAAVIATMQKIPATWWIVGLIITFLVAWATGFDVGKGGGATN
ncbi:MAG: hypothetical protein ACD_24C00101G0002 [uncultured bacterium]|uniref:Uncharacterized protein n=1 Tax=candidate division WWE3 bacterium RBG_16_37_10 TaxID=1802610 RepID=A0A1F4UT72_UNCKA|nr:MAG: hypothetical protein ACD_24C00101G0002 [uncultured bacterium]OGC48145.1 MAG: hypothetical protein A2W32_01565 [candidate division WWE3 bacterium RBG_16_37_10]